MYNDINIQFNNAKKLYDSKMYEGSLNFYEQIFKVKQENFTKNNTFLLLGDLPRNIL